VGGQLGGGALVSDSVSASDGDSVSASDGASDSVNATVNGIANATVKDGNTGLGPRSWVSTASIHLHAVRKPLRNFPSGFDGLRRGRLFPSGCCAHKMLEGTSLMPCLRAEEDPTEAHGRDRDWRRSGSISLREGLGLGARCRWSA
jgi:hypothetical protein